MHTYKIFQQLKQFKLDHNTKGQNTHCYIYSVQHCSVFAQFTSIHATSHWSQISAKLHISTGVC